MKGSIQLSANFIVVMVLTLMVIGTGFAIFIPMLTSAPDMVKEIDDYCNNYLDVTLRDTNYAFCKNNIKIDKGKQGIAWLGIVNSYDNNACFKITADSIAFDGEGSVSLTSDDISILDLVLDSHAQGSAGVIINTKTVTKGSYAITINIEPKDENCINNNDITTSVTVSRKLFVRVV